MGLSKTWYTSANRAMDDVSSALRSNASILFALKGFLTGALTGTGGTGGQPPSSAFWTVDSSSKSTAAGAGDQFSASFVAAEWVRAAAGVAHSWYVLKSPVSAGITDGPWYMLISWGTSSDNAYRLAISKTQPTGGTTTADPTVTAYGDFGTAVTGLPGSATNGKCHIVMDAKGNFHFLQSFNGGGRFVTWMTVQELVEARSSGDAARVVAVIDMLNSTTGVPRPSGFVGTGWRGFSNDGTTAVDSTHGKMAILQWTGGNSDTSVRASLNAIDSKADAIPMLYVYDTTAAHTSLRGRVPDVWFMGAQVAVGSGTPTAASPDRVMAGEVLIPFSVSPSL